MTKSICANLSRTLATVVVLYAVGAAQVSSEKPSETVATTGPSKVVQPLPFQPGEQLVYEVSFSKLIFSGVVGDIKLSVSKPADPTLNMIDFKAEAVSRGFFPTLLGLKVRDTYSSTVNAIDLVLHSFKRSIEEGKTRRELTSVINCESGRVTYTERDLSDTKAQPKVKEAGSPAWTQDVLSAMYFIRAQKLHEGDVIAIPISDAGDVYNIEVVVGKREELKLDLGKFIAARLDARVFDGRFIKRSGEMALWVSDDPKRFIVRVRIKTSGVTVTVDLKRVSHGGDPPASRANEAKKVSYVR
jgi:hypothetical protein